MTAINLFVRFLSGEQQRYWSEEEAARGEEARLKDEGGNLVCQQVYIPTYPDAAEMQRNSTIVFSCAQ